MFTRAIVTSVVFLAAIAPARAQDSGRDVLRASAEAVSKINGAMLTVKRYGTDTYAPRETTGEARVQILRSPDHHEEWMVRVSGAASPRGGAPMEDFDAVWTAEGITWMDHKNKKVMVRSEGSARAGAIAVAKLLRPTSVLTPEPYADELAADTVNLVEDIEIEGVACQQVELVNPKTKRTTRIAISKEDKLPRRFQTMSASTAIKGSAVLDILEFSTAIEVRADAFIVPLPEGYTRDTVSAPVTSKPPVDVSGTLGSTPAKAPEVGAEPGPPVLSVAAPFELSKADGAQVSLESLRGQVVILEFFGSWCLPARDLHGELKTLMEELAGKPVKLLALSVREKTKEAPTQALAEFGPAFELLIKADDVARSYGVTTYPTLILINARGEIVTRAEGYKKVSSPVPDLKSKISELLGEAAPTTPAVVPAPDSPAPQEPSDVLPPVGGE